MITKTLIVTSLTLAICLVVNAGSVYKWDEDGRTIYSQTPPPPGVKFEIIVEENIGKSTAVAKAKSSSPTSSSTFEERRQERLQKQQEKEVLEESNRIKQENCKIAENNMRSLTSRGQVTVKRAIFIVN